MSWAPSGGLANDGLGFRCGVDAGALLLWRPFPHAPPASWRRPVTPRYLTHRVSVEHPTFSMLLVALYDANTPTQDRNQLGVAELVEGAVVVDRRVDYLHG